MPDAITVKAVTEAANYASSAKRSVAIHRFTHRLLAFAIGWMARWFMARNDALQARVDGLPKKDFNDFLQTRYTATANSLQENTNVLKKAVETLYKVAEILKSASDNIERRKLQ